MKEIAGKKVILTEGEFLRREEANKRIYATTDKEKGAVKVNADANNWETFVVPDDIGGRFSVLTAVGLLPIAASGADIKALMEGANAARKEYSSSKISEIRITAKANPQKVSLLALFS